MNIRAWWVIVVVLFVLIIALAWILFATPAPVQAPSISSQASSTPQTPATSTTPTPLHERVVVSSPVSGATVGHTLTMSGEAPGNWYFEASFPIKVTTPEGDTIGTGHADAQSDWMTTEQVPFTATIELNMAYSGPATVALLRDNPSGLPENDDSIEISIVVQ